MSSSKSNENPETSVCVNKITFNMAIATYLEGKASSPNVQKWDPKAVSEAIRFENFFYSFKCDVIQEKTTISRQPPVI